MYVIKIVWLLKGKTFLNSFGALYLVVARDVGYIVFGHNQVRDKGITPQQKALSIQEAFVTIKKTLCRD